MKVKKLNNYRKKKTRRKEKRINCLLRKELKTVWWKTKIKNYKLILLEIAYEVENSNREVENFK